MDDRTTSRARFEARLARALEEVAGPVRSVDAAGIARAAIAKDRPRRVALGRLARTRLGIAAGFAALAVVVAVGGVALHSSSRTSVGGSASHSPPPAARWFLFGGDAANTPPGGIYVGRADGTDQRRVAEAEWPWGALWSPDGSHIAFGDRTTWNVLDVRTGGVRTVGEVDADLCMSAAWSPDGDSLAWLGCRQDAPAELRVAAVEGSGSVRLQVAPGGPTPPVVDDAAMGGVGGLAWAPDGTLAFACSDGIANGLCLATVDDATIARGTVAPRMLATSDAVPSAWTWSHPRWSPDGRSLVAVANGPSRGLTGGRDGSIVLVDPATELVRVLATGSDGKAPEREAERGTGFESARPITPSWTPDGRSILYGRYRVGRLPHVLGWSLDIDGGEPRLLAPSWQPMGGAWASIVGLAFDPNCTLEVASDGSSLVTRGYYSDSGVIIGTLDGDTPRGYLVGPGVGSVCPSWQPRSAPISDVFPRPSPAPRFSEQRPSAP